MDKQLVILLILHFAVKMKDGTHSSDETYGFTGLTQNKISQYFNGVTRMPRASRIALAQHIMYSLGIHKPAFVWLDSLNKNSLNNSYVKSLIAYTTEYGKLDVPRGRTEAIAKRIVELYHAL